MIRGHIGCGSIYLNGWVNVDVPAPGMHLASDRPDLAVALSTEEDAYYARHEDKTLERLRSDVARVTGVCDRFGHFDRLPFESGTVDEILCRQVFEHLSLSQAQVALVEVQRVLKAGGKFRVDVPDVEETAKMLSQSKDPFYIRHLFGSRKDEFGYHLMGYNREGLIALCAGFVWIREEPNIHFYPAFCMEFTR